MKIAVVNSFYPPRPGGSSNLTEQLSLKLSQFGHEVIVLTSMYKDSSNEESFTNLKIFRLESRYFPKTKLSFNFDIPFVTKLSNFKKIFKILKEFKPDIVQLNGQFFDLTWICGFWARINRVNSTLTIYTRLQSPFWFTNMLFRIIDFLIVYPLIVVVNPKKLVYLDSLTLDYINKRYRKFKNKTQYIQLGLDLKKFSEVSPIVENFDILSLGHVIPLRNRIALIESMKQIIEKYPKAVLNIVGGKYFKLPEELTKSLNLSSHVVFHGKMRMESVISFIQKSQICVQDIHGHGISLASLEAMASGIPVLINTPSDYFPHAKFMDQIHYFAIGKESSESIFQAVDYIFSNREKSRQVGIQGREFVLANFNIETSVDLYLKLFFQLSNNSSKE
jgi:glycosyltransferase involved in cell wall biosynthesis